MKVIPQKAGSDSEASARALATEQPNRAWLFAGRSGSPKGEAAAFGKESRGGGQRGDPAGGGGGG